MCVELRQSTYTASEVPWHKQIPHFVILPHSLCLH